MVGVCMLCPFLSLEGLWVVIPLALIYQSYLAIVEGLQQPKKGKKE
jgi:hypothetical protein